MVALAQRRTEARARLICLRRVKVAREAQDANGDSAIMVSLPSLNTRWRSPSASGRMSVTAAVTRKMCRSTGSRVYGRLDGAGRADQICECRGLDREQARTVLQGLDRPTLDPAEHALLASGTAGATERGSGGDETEGGGRKDGHGEGSSH